MLPKRGGNSMNTNLWEDNDMNDDEYEPNDDRHEPAKGICIGTSIMAVFWIIVLIVTWWLLRE